MVAALHANARQQNRDVWYVHGTRNGADHALADEVEALVAGNDRLHKHIFFSRPSATDELGSDYDVQGRVSVDDLLALGAGPDARYMLCGPAAFLAILRVGLEDAGVSPEKIHFETFGPTG